MCRRSMAVRLAGGLIAVLAAGVVVHAQSSPGSTPIAPSGTGTSSATVGSTTTTIAPAPVGTSGKVLSTGTTTVTSGGATMTVGGTGNTDPWIVYSLSASNPTDDFVFFSFVFEIPITQPFLTDPLASLELTLTDGGDDGVTLLQPVASDFSGGDFDLFDVETPLAVQRTLLGTLTEDTESIEFLEEWEFGKLIDVGGEFFTPSGGTFFFSFPDIPALAGSDSASILALPDFVGLGIVVGFKLSPGDTAEFTAYTQTSPQAAVPLPPNLVSALIGLGGLGGVFGWRNRLRFFQRAA